MRANASDPRKVLLHSRPPTFNVNLTRPPGDRWIGVMGALGVLHPNTWSSIFTWHNDSLFNNLKGAEFDIIQTSIAHHFQEQDHEVRGMAREFRKVGVPVSYQYLCAWAYSHELSHAESNILNNGEGCTAIIAEDLEGDIHHVALMDQQPIEIRSVVLHVRFVFGDTLLFEGSDWYWFTTGLTRMVKKSTASLQENWRWPPDKLLPRNIVTGDVRMGVIPQSWVFRSALMEFCDFVILESHLASMRLAAPYYVAIGGTRSAEGVLFARAGLGEADNVSGPGIERLSPTTGIWYLVQTNNDRWKPDPTYDYRRTYAEVALVEAGRGRGSTALGLLGVANLFPIRNPTTSHIVVMSAEKGTIETFILEPTIVVDVDAYSRQGIAYARIDPMLYFGDPSKMMSNAIRERMSLSRHGLSGLVLVLLASLVILSRIQPRRQSAM